MICNIPLSLLLDTRQITSPNDNVRGEIKLSVQYHRGALTVMVKKINFSIHTETERQRNPNIHKILL